MISYSLFLLAQRDGQPPICPSPVRFCFSVHLNHSIDLDEYFIFEVSYSLASDLLNLSYFIIFIMSLKLNKLLLEFRFSFFKFQVMLTYFVALKIQE